MKYAVLLLAGVMLLGATGGAVAGHSAVCLNVSAMAGLFLSLVSNGTPSDTDLLAVPGAIFDSVTCH